MKLANILHGLQGPDVLIIIGCALLPMATIMLAGSYWGKQRERKRWREMREKTDKNRRKTGLR